MNVLKHKLTLEMTALDSQVTVRIKKDDTKNRLIISLSENGKPYEITENLHARFVGKKPDGTIVFNDCDIVGNTIEYTITAQTSVAVGIVACELRLYDTDDNLLTSPRFTLVVDEIIYNADEIQKESENELGVLDTLISEVADMKEKLDLELNWKTVEPNGEDSYLLEQGKLYRIYGTYASADVEPYLQVFLTVNPGFSGEYIQTYMVDEAYSLGFAENNGCVTVHIIGCDIINDTNVNVRYLLNGEERTSAWTVDNHDGESLEANVYATLICADIGNTTVYEERKDEGLDINLNDYLKAALFDEYINGNITMPNPIVDRLDVVTHANFDGTVNIKEPNADNNPATKKYVDEYFNGKKQATSIVTTSLLVPVGGNADIEGALNVPTPTNPFNAANKQYVDGLFANIEIAEDGEY